jgi:hypothetical protein
VSLQPSPKRILFHYLTSRTAITDLGTVSSSDVPDGVCVRFWLIPGGQVVMRRYVTRHRFQIDCFGVQGSDGDDADLLARTVQAELADDAFLGAQTGGGTVVAVDMSVPADEPDTANPGQERPRQMFDLYLTVHS